MNPLTALRSLATAAVAVATVAALAGCTGGVGGGESDSVVIASLGGAFQKAQTTAFFDPYEKVAGVDVTPTEGSSYDKLKAMVDSGLVDWDVVDVDGPTYFTEAREGLLEPINYDIVKADGIPEELKQEYGVGYIASAQVLAWSNKTFPQGLTPEQFFDPSVKARRVLGPNPNFTMEFALLADGVEPEDIYPLDVDRALSILDRIRGQIIAFKSPSDVATLVQQGEVDAAFMGNGRIETAIEAGADWSYTWKDAIAFNDYWVVPKGASNVEGAMQFINFAATPEPQAAMAEAIPYGPTNTHAFDLIDDQLAARLPTYPPNAAQGLALDPKWWSENLADLRKKWDQWLL
jgi:putative spermidine/putrescine transport system substrate-binding protein